MVTGIDIIIINIIIIIITKDLVCLNRLTPMRRHGTNAVGWLAGVVKLIHDLKSSGQFIIVE
jgi:hypothetical protein